MPMNDPEAVIDRYLAFVDGFVPMYSATIAPAAEEDVGRLEELTGRPLPAVYRAALLRMGGSFGNLKAFTERNFSLELVLDQYEMPPWAMPPRYQLIGGDVDDANDYCFDLDAPADGDFEIVTFPRGPEHPKGTTSVDGYHRIFSSFVEMLFFLPLQEDHVALLPYGGFLEVVGDAARALAQLDVVATELGAARVQELRGNTRGYLGTALALAAWASPGQSGWRLRVGSRGQRDVARAVAALEASGFFRG